MTEQLIVMREGMAYTFEARLMASSPISQFMEVLNDRHIIQPIWLPVADKSCIMYTQYGKRRFYLCYLEPKPRTLVYSYRIPREAPLKKVYQVINPHWYIGLFFNGANSIEDGFAFIAKKKLASVNDGIGMMPMPNIYEGYGKICTGGAGVWANNIAPQVNIPSYLDYFLTSEFNNDIISHFNKLPPELTPPEDLRLNDTNKSNDWMFTEWEKLSKTKTPDEMAGLEWRTTFTLAELFSYYWKVAVTERA